MAVDRRWVLALSTIAACFLVVFSNDSPDPECSFVAETSRDLQNFLNSSLDSACNTITLLPTTYTLSPFNLSGASIKRSIIGKPELSIYPTIKYESSADLSRVFNGAQLKLSKLNVASANSKGGFLRVFGDGSQITLDQVIIRRFRIIESAVIEINEGAKIFAERSSFEDNYCVFSQSLPESCKRGVLYLGQSREAVEPNTPLIHQAELWRVYFRGFAIFNRGLSRIGHSGLVLSSNGTVQVITTSISFVNNEGVALFADGGASSQGRVYITPVDNSAVWSFSGNSLTPSCAILVNTESNVSWSFSHNEVENHAMHIRDSVIRAILIDLDSTERNYSTTSRGASLAAEHSEIYADVIDMVGASSRPTSMAGLSSLASTIVATSIRASKLDPALHFFPSPHGPSILNVSESIMIQRNTGGMIVEFTKADPEPVYINTGQLSFISNGNWMISNSSYESLLTGGISMKNFLVGIPKYSNYLEINANSILFDGNHALRGGAISYTVPFSLNSPSITFKNNSALSGGVYYSQDRSFKDFIPGELFQSSTIYESNLATQGCIITFADKCPALQPFSARFEANQNGTYPAPVPVSKNCPISEEYCSYPPPSSCGDVPSFGLHYMWRFQGSCELTYMGHLQIPIGSVIDRTFEVKGELTFEYPRGRETSAPTYSLIMKGPARIIVSYDRPLDLPRFPISYTVLDSPSKVVIFQGSEISQRYLPRVDFFVPGENKGLQFECAQRIPDDQNEFGFQSCKMEKVRAPSNPSAPSKPNNKSTPKMIIIVALAVSGAVIVSVAAVVAIYCVFKKRSNPKDKETQRLFSDIEY